MTATTLFVSRHRAAELARSNDGHFPGQIARFATIGVASTAAYVALYAALRTFSPAAAANAFALVITAVGNTAANRRFTFGVQGSDGLARHHAAGLISLAVALAITSSALAILDFLAPHPARLIEMAVLMAANAAATVVRFLLLRLAIDPVRPVVAIASQPASLPMSTRTRG